MFQFKLKSGHTVTIDNEDRDRVMALKWWAKIRVSAATGEETVYAHRRENRNGKKVTVFLHHFILGVESQYPGGPQVGHKNMNSLDCQKANLEFCSPSENALNTVKAQNAKNYFYHSGNKRFMVRVRGKFVGNFKTEEEAKEAVRVHTN